jgi:ATP-dependent Clp protease protease subunit
MAIEQTGHGERTFDIYDRRTAPSRSRRPGKDISLGINCPGGSVYAGLAIYDTTQFVKPQVLC